MSKLRPIKDRVPVKQNMDDVLRRAWAFRLILKRQRLFQIVSGSRTFGWSVSLWAMAPEWERHVIVSIQRSI
jgi:hypothetical protein